MSNVKSSPRYGICLSVIKSTEKNLWLHRIAHVINQIHISVNFFDWCCLKYVLDNLWITNIKKEPVNRFRHEHMYSLNFKSSQFILLVQNVKKSLKELIWFQLEFVLYFKSMLVNAVKSMATSFTLEIFEISNIYVF